MNTTVLPGTYKWIRISLFNFFIVALAGVILRYKIVFPLPFVNQKYLLNAHSHFAFAGWLTQILMAFITDYLLKKNSSINIKRYEWLMRLNLITAYGMLLSFPFVGYAGISITFSTLSIFVSYTFVIFAWKDLSRITDGTYISGWFKASLVLFAVSSLGAFALAALMATHANNQYWYFAALYFFLHFQYNGWFLFACFGLLFYYLQSSGFIKTAYYSKKILRILFISCFPAYLLSTLWMPLPQWMHTIADAAGVFQLLVLPYIVLLYIKARRYFTATLSATAKYLWAMAFIAFCIKIALQALSVIPALSKFAFGFRPLVIGYLHLSFLGIISFFILGYCNEYLRRLQLHLNKTGAVLFVAGVLITETTLMVQGFEAIRYEYLPYANMVLFAAALLMLLALLLLSTWMQKNKSAITG